MTDTPDPVIEATGPTGPTGELERLVAIEAIEQLKARYFRLMDTKQWEAWAQVFTTDAVMEVPEADLELHGAAEIAAYVSAVLEGARTAHHGHMPEIEVTGADAARGTWAMVDLVEWPTGPDGNRVGLQGYGHYLEEYRRTAVGWQIARTRLERLRIDPL